MKTIYDFKKGDRITRIKPSKSLGPIMTLSGDIFDRGGDMSYMGEEMIFIGIANGQIYIKPTSKFDKMIFGDRLINLPIDLWDDGWENYIEPKTLLNNDNENNSIIIDKSTIEERIQKAVEREDYELAEKLKSKLLTNINIKNNEK